MARLGIDLPDFTVAPAARGPLYRDACDQCLRQLLPDSDPIRKRVAERVGAEGSDAYSLLTALGHDCVGALQFLPDGVDAGTAGSADGKAVSDDDIADIIKNLASAPLGMGEDEEFRISIAGAQEKTALLRKDGRWLKPTGTAATTHILKPQIGTLPSGVDLSSSVENEYLCLKLLAALGVPTATAEIADFGDRRTLIVERFDRLWTKDGRLLRRPQEDTCQALSIPPTRKYQSDGGPGMRDILELLKGSDRPTEDIATFLRANIVFWLIGATDGHAKNFSLFLGPGGRFSMTPLYDVLTAQPSLDANQIRRNKFKLAMSAQTAITRLPRSCRAILCKLRGIRASQIRSFKRSLTISSLALSRRSTPSSKPCLLGFRGQSQTP
jgi:serine/threonine-protein kinase HipA